MLWAGNAMSVRVLFSQAGLATQILIQAGSIKVLVDAGDGTLRDLLREGIAPSELAGVFFTHGHADHIGGLFALLGYLRGEGHAQPFHIWHPAGCCESAQLVAAFRTCNEGTIPFPLEVHGLSDRESVRFGDLEVIGYCVTHWHSIAGTPLSPAPAMGYRLSFRGEVVAISGDSAGCPALAELIAGADLALIEASLTEDSPSEQKSYLHLTTHAAQRLGRLARRAAVFHRPGPGEAHLINPGEREVINGTRVRNRQGPEDR